MCIHKLGTFGVFLKNENKLHVDEIVDILQHLQKYTPSTSRTREVPVPTTNEVRSLNKIALHWLLFGGDQLTAKRARGARGGGVCIRNNSANSADHVRAQINQ